MDDKNLYFGEIHTHTDVSDGNGSAEDNFAVASRRLDFWAMADHAYDPVVFPRDYRLTGGKLLNEEWPRIQELCRIYEKPGAFIPFLAYEWSHAAEGHHNVYFRDYDGELVMPPTLKDLYAALRGKDAVAIPHHVGYPRGAGGKDWSVHDEELTPFVEIFSVHGACERPGVIDLLTAPGSWMGPGAVGGSVQEALACGYRLGIMASSDSHAGHPGGYGTGLMAVWAKELTRQSLWDAWKQRRVYGITGDRIQLEFSVNGSPMGSVIEQDGDVRRISIKAVCRDALDRLEILKNNRIIHTVSGSESGARTDLRGKRILSTRVEWFSMKLMFAQLYKNERGKWKGSLTLSDGRFLKAIPCFRGTVESNLESSIAMADNRCEWTSVVQQATMRPYNCGEALCFDMEAGPDTRAELIMECEEQSRTLELTGRDLVSGPEVYFLHPRGASDREKRTWDKFKVHRAAAVENLTYTVEIEDDTPETREDFYCVRVSQQNGHRAWSSPVWVRKTV